MEYLEALEQEQIRRRQRRTRRKSSTNKSMEDPTNAADVADEHASFSETTDSEDYHHFQVIISKQKIVAFKTFCNSQMANLIMKYLLFEL